MSPRARYSPVADRSGSRGSQPKASRDQRRLRCRCLTSKPGRQPVRRHKRPPGRMRLFDGDDCETVERDNDQLGLRRSTRPRPCRSVGDRVVGAIASWIIGNARLHLIVRSASDIGTHQTAQRVILIRHSFLSQSRPRQSHKSKGYSWILHTHPIMTGLTPTRTVKRIHINRIKDS